MTKFAIVHFAPLELYPPVQNLVREIEKRGVSDQVLILTTRHPEENSLFVPKNTNINIVRIGRSSHRLRRLQRYVNYLFFYLTATLRLMWLRPSKVMYIETLSSLPVYLFKLIFPSAWIFIHYHEYTSAAEYKSGMRLVKYFHALEKRLYPSAVWVSHTNEFRLTMFRNDILPIQARATFVLPNYPPENWSHPNMLPARSDDVLKIIYVGALSMENFYVREFASWINEQKGKVQWDLYSNNISVETKEYLRELGSEFIRYCGGVPYNELPDILKKYDVGVILYKGHIPNYIFNAPNKLFEYMACGLAVWFPFQMTGSLPYVTSGTYPRIVPMDFTNTEKWSLLSLTDTKNLVFRRSPYFCGIALKPLLDKLMA